MAFREVAAEMGDRYLDALDRNEEVVSSQVTVNLWERHVRRLFI